MSSISVIVPTFNRASLIRRALESINAQTHPAIEIIILDDGSTDVTPDVVAGFARESSKSIIYHWQENAGCAAARNMGLALATGDFITFLDSDDAWLPTAAESLIKTLIQSGADFAYSPAIEIYEDGSERVNYPVAAGRPDGFAVEHFQDTNLRNGAFMFRRKVLSSVRGINESLLHNEDSDFIQRIAIQYTAAYCPDPTVKVFHHEGNKSRNRVGIYRALIESAESVLAQNPVFAAKLGDSANLRMRELENRYLEALMLAGKHEEASKRAASVKDRLDFVVRVAVKTRSARVLTSRDHVARWKRRVGRKLGGSRSPRT